MFSIESTRTQRTVWHIWIFIEKFGPDWSDTHVAESSTRAMCDCKYQRNKVVDNEHNCELRFFSSFSLSLLLSPFFLPPVTYFLSPNSHLLIITVSTSLPHSLTFIPFSCFTPLSSPLLGSRVDPPPIPLCRIITMNPLGPVSAPCISPTRGVDEEAIIASSQRRWCLQTGLELSISTFTGQTGNPVQPSPSWTAHTLQFQLDPEKSLQRRSPEVYNMCVDSFQCVASLCG